VVFSTKHREPLLQDPIPDRLHGFIGGIIRNHGGALIAAGGMPDHLHLLIHMPTNLAIADLMREVKATTSAWIKREFSIDFAWQDGYGAFSVSASALDAVKDYIANQADHHKQRDSKAEFIALLERHGVKADHRYIE
jgi:REP element-mobilizing transposase RayT